MVDMMVTISEPEISMRGVSGVVQRHACVDHVANELEDGGEDFPAAACAQRSPAAVVKSQSVGTYYRAVYDRARRCWGARVLGQTTSCHC